MKSDLIITRFKTEPVIGTKDSNDVKTFFGSKMIDVEDIISVDNSKIQYSEVFDSGNTQDNGYQYYEDIDYKEKIYLKDLSLLKSSNHSINLVSQSNVDLKNNTQWTMTINWKNILSEYILYKLKNRRTFKCIKYTDVMSENINIFMKKYIQNNLIGRYEFNRIDFYIKYYDLNAGDEYTDPNLLFDPIFTSNTKTTENQIKNINATVADDVLLVNYKQTQSSETQKFDYYFDLIFIKI